MADTKLWTTAFEALQNLYQFEGGNAVIRVLGRFFLETKDHRFLFNMNRKAFMLFAVETGWYDDVIGRVDSFDQSVKIGPEQARRILETLSNEGLLTGEYTPGISYTLKTLGITKTDLEDIINSTKEENNE